MPDSSSDAPGLNTWDVSVMPFVDMTMGHNLSDYSKATGITGFALAFVGVVKSTTTFTWTWGGYSALPTPKNFEKEISDFTTGGGVPVISFGGGKGILPEHHIDDHDVLLRGYQDVINGYNVRHIDFDIEANVMSKKVREKNVALVSGLLKSFPNLGISYSLEVNAKPNPDDLTEQVGINSDGLDLLRRLAAVNIVPSLVNLLIEYLPPRSSQKTEWDFAKDVMEAAHKQLTDIFKIQDAWGYIGACPMYENTNKNVWTTDDHKKLRQFAETHNIGCISGWNANYDAAHEYTYEKIQSGYHPHRADIPGAAP